MSSSVLKMALTVLMWI